MNKSKKVGHLFEKKIDFENNEDFELPDEVFNCDKWSISCFQNLKKELNSTKSLLNQFNLEEWSRHTKRRDPSSYIIRFVKQKFHAELVTQAWCKFYECLSNCPIISKDAISCGSFSSVHVCEAPGAFISALNHYMVSHDLNLQWEWFVNSLNPDYEGNSLQEMISDDRLLRHTYKNWYFGVDCTGNITKYYNHDDLLNKINKKVHLVTADGSVDCSSDPGNQELYVAFLHYCETLTALSLLKNGGTFILKIFTIFEDSTVCLLYLLNVIFRKVSVFKPASSKSGNSEVYVICLDYKGTELVEKIWTSLMLPYKNGKFDLNKSMFDLSKISKDFLNQLLRISEYFMKKQIERINDNIFYFKNETQSDSSKIHQMKVNVANRFIHKYRLKAILPNYKLVGSVDVSQFPSNEFKKFNFVNRIVKFDVKNLIPVRVENGVLDIILGEKICAVLSSRFCAKDCLENFKLCSNIKRKSCLYENIEKRISQTTTVVSIGDCCFSTYHEFQRHIFYKIFNSSKTNFVIVKVPFVTNFLVGLMYILISCYEEVFLHESGFIVLYQKESNFKNIKSIFELVDKAYRSTGEHHLFPCDIFQIVAPNTFYNNSFYEFIWNYNNFVLSKFDNT